MKKNRLIVFTLGTISSITFVNPVFAGPRATQNLQILGHKVYCARQIRITGVCQSPPVIKNTVLSGSSRPGGQIETQDGEIFVEVDCEAKIAFVESNGSYYNFSNDELHGAVSNFCSEQ